MNFDTIRNTKRNIFFAFINRTVSLFFPFVLRTIIIRKLGADYLGLTSLFSSILQILNLAELGFGSAIVFSMYKPVAKDDYVLLGALLRYFRKVYLAIGLFILLAGLFFLPFLPKMIKGGAPSGINIYLLYCLYLANTCISYCFFAYKRSLLIAYQRNDIISNVDSSILILSHLLQICVILLTKNYYAIVYVLILCTILTNVCTEICANRLFPSITCKGDVNAEQKLVIRSKLKGLMISKVSGASRNALDSIILSITLGLTDVAKYNNYFSILMMVSNFIIIIASSMLAGIGNTIVTKSVSENFENCKIFNFLYTWIAGFASICFLCLCQPFVEFCFGWSMLFHGIPIYLFALYCFLLRQNDMVGLYYEANGFWTKGWFVYISEAAMNIVLNIFLGRKFGTSGIIFATILSITVTSNLFIPLIVFKLYFIGKSFLGYVYTQACFLFVTCIVGFITFRLCLLFDFGCLTNFFIRLGICCVLVNILFFLFYFHTGTYRLTVSWIKTNIVKKVDI